MQYLNHIDLILLEAILIPLNKPKLFKKEVFDYTIPLLSYFLFNLNCTLFIGFITSIGNKLSDYFIHF